MGDMARADGWNRAFWLASASLALPIAAVAAAAGFTTPHAEPARDLGVLALWSVAEEIVFRGALQPALARLFGRRGTDRLAPWLTRSNVATSAVFAAAHLWRHPWPLALAVFPVSIVYGRAREISGEWWPAALLHLWFNACLYAASWWLSTAS